MQIRFLPTTPRDGYFVRVAMQRLGWTCATRLRDASVAWKWLDRTSARTPLRLRAWGWRGPVINARCHDIGKWRVGRVFASVFGYPLDLDPRTHVGIAVRKSNENYAHDGEVLPCPIVKTCAASTYSKLVDNTVHPEGFTRDEQVFDLRTPFLRGAGIPYVLVKAKRRSHRFAAGGDAAPRKGPTYSLHEPDEVFDATEQRQIAAFCDEMGLDVCELDILRDRHDGRIYIVDANWTPWGPTSTLAPRDRAYVVDRWAQALSLCVARAGRMRWTWPVRALSSTGLHPRRDSTSS